MRKRALGVLTTLAILLLGVGSMGRAAPALQAQSKITHPTDGMTISGEVEVKGIATHPNMDFYQVRYAAGPKATGGSQWKDFAIVEGKQVENDVLGTWNTTRIPDGKYTLALAVWGVGDSNNPYLYFVTDLTVNNAQPVETPTIEEEPTKPMPSATPGPTPTPVAVEQPASPTPRPTLTPQLGADETPTPTGKDEGPSVALDLGQLRGGFCTGGLITILLLSLWGIYLLARVGLRWYLRQGLKPPWR